MKRIFTILLAIFASATLFGQLERTVIVEHFTNTQCGTCAARNPALFSLLDNYPQVLHIAYHPSSPYSSCAFSQHNQPENDERTNFYGIYGSTPRVVLSGEVIGFQNPILNAGQIENALGQTSDFEVMAMQEQNSENEVMVEIKIKRISGSSTNKVLLFAMIAEENVVYAAPNGENSHHNVFRKVLLDDDFTLLNVGDSLVFNESYEIHSAWNEDELFVTLILQKEGGSNEVLQAYATPTLDAGASFISDKEVLSLDGMLYPNPAIDQINLKADAVNDFQRIELYAVTGNLVKTFHQPRSMDVSDIPEGIYMAVLIDKDQQKHVTRIVKQ